MRKWLGDLDGESPNVEYGDETFPGLWLNVPAVLSGDMLAALETLALGVKSSEHTAFVAKLQATATRKKRS